MKLIPGCLFKRNSICKSNTLKCIRIRSNIHVHVCGQVGINKRETEAPNIINMLYKIDWSDVLNVFKYT